MSGPRAVVVAGAVEPREVARWAWVQGRTYGHCAVGGGFLPAVTSGGHAVWGAHPPEVFAERFDALPDLPAAITSTAIDPRELARWLRVTSSNRLINLDPTTLRNTGNGGSRFGGAEFCTPIDRLADATEMHMAPRRTSTRPPLFVELCAGTAALSLRLHGGRHCRPPVSRMGAKTGYADAILEVLGLRPGQGADRYLWCEPDDGARLMLIAYTDEALRREAAAIIRGWADEDPRALWERLRDEGAVKGCPAAWVAGVGAVDAREVARWGLLAQACYRRGQIESGYDDEAARGRAHPATVCGPVLADLPDLPATVLDGATDPPAVPPGTVCYMDPPYVDTTGYASDLARAEVVRLARAWADAGAWVVISEQEPIPELMADGWHAVDITDTRKGQRRTFSKQQREWLTLSKPPLWTPDVQVSLW